MERGRENRSLKLSRLSHLSRSICAAAQTMREKFRVFHAKQRLDILRQRQQLAQLPHVSETALLDDDGASYGSDGDGSIREDWSMDVDSHKSSPRLDPASCSEAESLDDLLPGLHGVVDSDCEGEDGTMRPQPLPQSSESTPASDFSSCSCFST